LKIRISAGFETVGFEQQNEEKRSDRIRFLNPIEFNFSGA